MKLNVFLSFLIAFLLQVQAVTADPCKVTSISINSGLNADGSALRPSGQEDPHWYFSYSTAICAPAGFQVPAPVVTFDVPYPTYYGYQATNPLAKWVGYTDRHFACQEYTHRAFISRKFRTCGKDSFNININFACDDYCDSIFIDNIGYATTQVPVTSGVASYYGTLWNFNQTVFLDEGEHIITMKAKNVYWPYYENVFGIYIEGTVSSATQSTSIIDNGIKEPCPCGGASSCKVPSIGINSGFNDNASALVPSGQQDPYWYFSYSTAICAPAGFQVPAPVVAFDVPYPNYYGYQAANPQAQWVGYTDKHFACQEYDHRAFISRKFRTCGKDSFNININFACDDYCDSIFIDNIGYATTQVPITSGVASYYGTLWNFNQTVFLESGEHVITMKAKNVYWPYYENVFGIYIEGTISAATPAGSIINNGVKGDCPCDDNISTGNILNDKIYFQSAPNPASDQVTIHYSLPTTLNSASIRIVDLTGRVMKSSNIYNSNGQVHFNVANLPRGIYFYYLETDGAIVQAKKLLID
ncbi:MAG: hypothetical protein BGO09_00130 [Bacteroidetes bacterium 47-18]|nr:MAG: hypothetical protein BGO09_00130 [Bacteroidetes bacterium 47-18]